MENKELQRCQMSSNLLNLRLQPSLFIAFVPSLQTLYASHVTALAPHVYLSMFNTYLAQIKIETSLNLNINYMYYCL